MTTQHVQATELTPVASYPPFSTAWEGKELTCYESSCIRFWGTCYTGAGCGNICTVISLVVGAVCFIFTLLALHYSGSSTRSIVWGTGLGLSILGLLIGRCQVACYATSTVLRSPFTGQVLQEIHYPEITAAEEASRIRGEEFGWRCSQKYPIPVD